VLRGLPEAGVRLATLGQLAAEGADTAAEVELPTGSWGAGKDHRLWAGDAVADLAKEGREVADRLLAVVGRCAPPGSPRAPALDHLSREALLALSSDWAFMVSRDSAADYGRGRHGRHVDRFHQLADRALAAPAETQPPDERDENVVVPHLDARVLSRKE
jgi:1,4-alpha-glucan branching enzyme